jgi:hypothetical protein
LDREPVYLRAGFRWGMVNPVVAEYLFVLSKSFFLTKYCKAAPTGETPCRRH